MDVTRHPRQVRVHIPPGVAKKAVEDVGKDGDRSRQGNRLGPVLETEPMVQPQNDDC